MKTRLQLAGITGATILALSVPTFAADSVAAPVPAATSAEVPSEWLQREWSLSDLVDLGLGNNPRTQASWAVVRRSAAEKEAARSEYFPQLEASLLGGGADQKQAEDPGSKYIRTWNASAALELNYLLLDCGGRGNRFSAAKAAFAASQTRDQSVLQQTLLEIQAGFHRLQTARARLVEAEAWERLAKEQFEAATLSRSVGFISDNELLAADEQRSRASAAVREARSQLEQARGAVNTLAGIRADVPLKIAARNDGIHIEALDIRVDQLIATGLKDRPDLLASTFQVQEKMALARAAASGQWPELFLSGLSQYGVYGGETKFDTPWVGDNGNTRFNGVFLGVSWNVFDGFYTQSKTKAAEATAAESRALLESTRQAVVRDVWNAYYDVLTAAQTVAYWQAAVRRADLDAAKSAEGEKNGLYSLLQRLDADARKASADAGLSRAMTDWLVSAAKLVYATGMGDTAAGAGRTKTNP